VPTIERVRDTDFTSLAQLVETTFVETWTGLVHDDHIRQHLLDGHAKHMVDMFGRDGNADILVVRDETELVGYAIGYIPDCQSTPRYYKLEKLYLRSAFQGTGIGSELWDQMMELGVAAGADGVMLTHYPQNERASRFYQRLGLKKVDETVYQCGDGEYRDWVMAANWSELRVASRSKEVMAE